MTIKITFETTDPKEAAEFLKKLGGDFVIDDIKAATVVEKKVAPAKKSRKAKKVDPVADAREQNDSDVDMDDLRQALLTLGSTHDLGLCADALSRVGAKKLSEVNPSKFKELHTILLEATETGDV